MKSHKLNMCISKSTLIPILMWNDSGNMFVWLFFFFFCTYCLVSDRQDMPAMRGSAVAPDSLLTFSWHAGFPPVYRRNASVAKRHVFAHAAFQLTSPMCCTCCVRVYVRMGGGVEARNSLWNRPIINHCLRQAWSYLLLSTLMGIIPTETGRPTWSSAVSLTDRSYAPGRLQWLERREKKKREEETSHLNQNRDNLYCD